MATLRERSAKGIAQRLGIGHNTIKRYLEATEREGLLEGGIAEAQDSCLIAE